MAQQKLPPFPFRIFLVPAVVLPIGAFIAFFQNHPLNARITAQIQFSPHPESVHHFTDLNNHVVTAGNLLIRVPEDYLNGRSDEELLTRLLKGYFDGVVFRPEKILYSLMSKFGRMPVPMGLSHISKPELAVEDISEKSLLLNNTVLSRTNCVVLDSSPVPRRTSIANLAASPAHIDVGYGDDKTSFAGRFRFDVAHDDELQKEDRFTTISYTYFTRNPAGNMPPFPGLMEYFQRWYATQLFRDGLRNVLAK